MNYQEPTQQKSSQMLKSSTISNIIAFPVRRNFQKPIVTKEDTAQNQARNLSTKSTASISIGALVVFIVLVIFLLMTLFATIGMAFCRLVVDYSTSQLKLLKRLVMPSRSR